MENGADAVYFGLESGFNARARADNISLQTLPELMQLLHGRGVKGIVTLNTLVFSEEIARFEQLVREVARAGVDAVLVQDVGMARLIGAICPDLDIHASTQMTMTSAETIAQLHDLRIKRVVLARELSLDEIRQIASEVSVELEVFAHGALCVAYSGQCMTSESLGGRSANRGQCAQACRLPYQLFCDGELVDLGAQQYLLSPQDLAAFELLPELIKIGVTCVKIEGRLKTPEYVANITRRYREAIDAASTRGEVHFAPDVVEEMELSFSRGFSPGWLRGCDHKMLVPATSSAKHGVRLGQVTAVQPPRIHVELRSTVRPGDGIVFDADRFQGAEQGGRVFEIWSSDRRVEVARAGDTVALTFARGTIEMKQIRPGQVVWKTDDPQLTKRLRKTFRGSQPMTRLPVTLRVQAIAGQPLRVEAGVRGHLVTVQSDDILPVARKHPLTVQMLRQQLSRLGHTAYVVDSMTAEIEGEPMVPLSVLGQVRRQLVALLDQALTRIPIRRIAEDSVLPQLRHDFEAADDLHSHPGPPCGPTLHVLARTLEQLDGLLAEHGISCLVDFADIRQYADAVRLARAAGVPLLIATPRIQKPGEMGIFRAMARHEPEGVLARNLAAMAFFRPRVTRLVADYGLNCTNEITADWIVRHQHADRVTASYDLNRDQLLTMVAATPAHWLEVVIHQHMPMFHMEHCVFCALLSPGTNKTNCGRPCDVHQVSLRDRVGMQHVLHADVGCRNTLYNAQPQSAAEVVPALLAAGLRHFRVELLGTEPPHEVRRLVRLYTQLLRGELSGRQVWTELKASNRVGVTRGTLEEKRNPLAIL